MSWRLFWAFKLVLTLVLLLSIAAWWLAQDRLAETTTDLDSAATTLSDDTTAAILSATVSLRGYLLTGDPDELAAYQAAVETYTANLRQIGADDERPDTAPLWATVAARLATQRAEFDEPSIALRQAVDAGSAPAASLSAFIAVLTAEAERAEVSSLLATIDDRDDAHAAQAEAAARRQTQRLQAVIIGGAAFIILSGLLLTQLIIRNISAPVARLSGAATAIAAGDLEQRVGWSGNDEIGRMAAAFDAMADRLQAQMAAQAAALAASRRQQATLRAVIDNVGVGIMLVDRDDRLVMANAAIATVLGVPADRFAPGTPVAELLTAFSAPVQATIAQLRHHGSGERQEQAPAVVVQPAPGAAALAVAIVPVVPADQPQVGQLWLIRDVTREHSVSEMKTEFVSMVAHELRTPLTSIKGYVDLLLDHEVGELSEEQRAFLAIVAQSTNRLATLINDLLDVSRIESGQVGLDAKPVDLRPVLSTVGEALRPLMDAKEQRFTLALPPAPLLVAGDDDRLAQVFTNLLSNAHKYSPPGSEIRIEAEATASEVIVSVIDHGIGLTDEEQRQLFTRFFRSANQAVQAEGGTGLGLAITHWLVEQHHGSLSVTSEANQGATFVVRLPRLAAVPAAGGAPEGASAPALAGAALPAPVIATMRG